MACLAALLGAVGVEIVAAGNARAAGYTAVLLAPGNLSASRAAGTSGGQQAGYGLDPSMTGGFDHALLWAGTPPSMIDLNPPGFTASRALAIQGGQQGGSGSGPATGGFDHALLWSGGAAGALDLNPPQMDSSTIRGPRCRAAGRVRPERGDRAAAARASLERDTVERGGPAPARADLPRRSGSRAASR